MISIMIKILLSFISIHLSVDGNIYHHGQYTNNPSHRRHKYNTNHLYHQHIQPNAAKASDYDLLIAQQELRDILRAHHQHDIDHGYNHLRDGVMYRYPANQPPHRHHQYNTNHLYHQHIQPYGAKINGYDSSFAQQELHYLSRRDNQNDDEWDEMVVDPNALQVTANVGVATAAHRMFEVQRGKIKVKWPTTKAGPLGAAELFTWHDYVHKLDGDLLTDPQKLSVYGAAPNGLRKETQERVIVDSCTDPNVGLALPALPLTGEACYNEMGSVTAKSDLDFSYIRWDQTDLVVQILVNFYNKIYGLYGGWPLKVFDMNFYDVTAFVKDKPNERCWATVNPAIHQLFGTGPLWTNGLAAGNVNHEAWYEFAGTYTGAKAELYQKHDSWLAYILIKRRFVEGLEEGGENERIQHVVRFSALFYFQIHEIQTRPALINNDDRLNKMKIFLKTLRYLINYWSDEAYLSNQALQLIIPDTAPLLTGTPDQGILLAILDNVAFIHHYYNKYLKGTTTKVPAKLLYFWNDASKYINRIGRLVNQLSAGEKRKPYYKSFKYQTSAHTAWPATPTAKKLKPFNLYSLAARWVRAWNDRDPAGVLMYGDGRRKIRGDVPFQYFLRKPDKSWKKQIITAATATATDPADSPFIQAAVPEARTIWTVIRERFRVSETERTETSPIKQLYHNIMVLTKYIQDEHFEKETGKVYKDTYNAIYKEIIDGTEALLGSTISVATTRATPIRYTAPTAGIANPFNSRENIAKLRL